MFNKKSKNVRKMLVTSTLIVSILTNVAPLEVAANDSKSEQEVEQYENTQLHDDEVLSKGSVGEKVEEYKHKLYALDFETTTSDEFDSETIEQTEMLQEYYGLEITGIADKETLILVDEAYKEIINTDNPTYHDLKEDNSNILSLGDINPQVKVLKEKLIDIDFVDSWNNFTDIYDEEVVAVIKNFQEHYNLEVTGHINVETNDKINELFNSLEKQSDDDRIKSNPQKHTPQEQPKSSGNNEFSIQESEEIQSTFSMMRRSPNTDNVLREGDNSPKVQEFKHNLMAAGFAPNWVNPSDYFGLETVEYVKDFQSYYGLPVTGVADEATANQLKQVLNSPYQLGNSSAKIRELKVNLMNLGFADHWANPSAYYGPETVEVVKNFQSTNGLVVNGIIDEITYHALVEHTDGPLIEGSIGEKVQAFKYDLMAAGFASNWVNPSNYFGPETVEYVKDFQSYYGLPVTGVVDEATANQLRQVLNSPYQLGNSSAKIRELKVNLMNLGFADHWDKPSAYYGPETVEVVKDFQRANDLAVNGIIDEITYQVIMEFSDGPLYEGSKGEKVQAFKYDLMAAGFASNWVNPSNYYGPETVEYVKDFQSYYGLTVTGMADEATVQQLKQVLNSPYQLGENSEGIRALKIDLMNLGFADHWVDPTPYYGSETVEIVKDFQDAHNLVANGIVDEITYQAIKESAPLIEGRKGERVRDFKYGLMAAGFAPNWVNPSDYFGQETVEYVKEFQTYYGLTVTGMADEVTVQQLNQVVNSPYQLGKTSENIRSLKIDLMNLGFADHWNNPSEYYGAETVEVVKNFQRANNLVVNGIIDEITYQAIKENAPLVEGSMGERVRDFKYDLIAAGFATNWSNPTAYFGPETVEYVKVFQSYYGLPVTGAADEATINQLNQVLNSPYQLGKSSAEIRALKDDLMLLGFADHWVNPTPYYGPETAEVVRNFQSSNNLVANGIIDKVTYALIEKQINALDYTHYNITLNQALNMQMRANPQTDKPYAYVSTDWVNSNGVVTASTLNVRSGAGTKNSVVGQLTQGTKVRIISEVNGWYQISYNHRTWVNAAKEDVKHYLDPNNFTNSERQMFQFLNLARPSGATAAELNEYLKGKGILHGMGQAFIDAGRIHSVNEVYLLSHALLETGHGTSTLARGVKVNGETVYNMYGIGAIDSNPIGGGSQYAYEAGWFTPEASIIGGASFIGNSYVKAGQNTLYKMRWNPGAMESYGYATHQYATDIGWASKQVGTMYNLYNDIGIKQRFLDIPVYKN